MKSTVQLRPIAPSYPQSPTDHAAHEAASYLSPRGRAALGRLERRLQEDAAYLERERQIAAEAAAEIAQGAAA